MVTLAYFKAFQTKIDKQTRYVTRSTYRQDDSYEKIVNSTYEKLQNLRTAEIFAYVRIMVNSSHGRWVYSGVLQFQFVTWTWTWLYLNNLEELHWFDGDVVLYDAVDHSAGTQLFAVDAFRRVYHSAALVDGEVVPVEDGRRRQEAESQAVDDRRVVAPVVAELGDQVADETVRRKLFDDEELANVRRRRRRRQRNRLRQRSAND